MTDESDAAADDLRMAQAGTLGALLQLVGYALWQAAECEDTLAHYLLVRVKAKPGIGEQLGMEILKKAQRRTFGSLFKELREAGVLSEALEGRLAFLLEERNWLVHHARRENRGVLHDLNRFDLLVVRIQKIADESLQLHKVLAKELEDFVVSSGVDRKLIDAEADKLMKEWGFLA